MAKKDKKQKKIKTFHDNLDREMRRVAINECFRAKIQSLVIDHMKRNEKINPRDIAEILDHAAMIEVG